MITHKSKSKSQTSFVFNSKQHARHKNAVGQWQVSSPEDAHERDAEFMVRRVMGNSESLNDYTANETDSRLDGNSAELINGVTQSSGKALDTHIRQQMERKFSADFSQVKVHDDSQAAVSAQAIQARAYTNRHHIVFGANEYSPNTRQGQHLLAHELAHVVQQSGGGQHSSLTNKQISPAVISRVPIAGRCFPSRLVDQIDAAWTDAFPKVSNAINHMDTLLNHGTVPSAIITSLQQDFRTGAGQLSRIRTIKGNFERILLDMGTVSYGCVNDPSQCPNGIAGLAVPGSHQPRICTNNFTIADMPNRIRVLIHETAHGIDTQMHLDSYRHNSYPGLTAANALWNADSYGSFAAFNG